MRSILEVGSEQLLYFFIFKGVLLIFLVTIHQNDVCKVHI